MARKLDRTSVEEILSLTPMQQGMLFHYLVTPESEMYFEQISLRITGNIDLALVRKAWNLVIETNPSLRTVFRWKNVENPVAIVLKQHDVILREFDFSEGTEAERTAQIENLRLADRQDQFDLEDVPFRITLCKLDQEESEMIISNHHILYDGWSNTMVLKEFLEAYDALKANRTYTKPIKHHVKEFIKYLRGLDKDKQRHFWETKLEGFEHNTLLPYDTGTSTQIGDLQLVDFRYELSQELSSQAQQFVKEQQMTLATLMYTVWGIVLQKHNRTDDVLFGTTVSGRSLEVKGVEDMVGLFMNTVPLRLQAEPKASIFDVLRQVHALVMERDEYASTPLVDIKNYAKAHGQKQLFDCIVAVENFPLEGLFDQPYCLKIKSFNVFEMTNFDLTLGINVADPISVRFKYNSNKFNQEMIERAAEQFDHILQQIIANPQAKIADLEIVTAKEQQKLLVDFASEDTVDLQDKAVSQLFEEQVAQTPDAVAVVLGEQSLTYDELNRRANQLAHYLQEQGVGADSLVGLCMERSLDMIVGLLGILKSGGAYVPLDPAYPVERLAYMLEDSKVQILVTQERLLGKLPAHDAMSVAVDAEWETIAKSSAENPVSGTTADNLAYVIYTSGSTGLPKGVLVPHRGIVRLVKHANYVNLSSDQVFLQASTISFDAATFEIWGSLLNGAKLAMMPPHMPTLEEIGQALQEYGVTTLWLTVGLFNLMVDSHLDVLKGVKQLLVGGDALSIPHIRRAFALEGTRVINGYGPTESTTFTCCHLICEEDLQGTSVPIGRPITNTQVYVLDEQGQLAPVGVPGELHIGGDGLALGYLNRPELTEEKFVPNPFSTVAGDRLYKTGDLVRYLPDGRIEFIGRIDNQVKIRGFRIEPGEIEAVLTEHPDVQKAVVLAREDVPGDKRLVAYVEANRDLSGVLRQYLKGKMPDYMIPSAFLMLDSMPLNANGKVDKEALPAPDQTLLVSEREYVAPRTPEEELVANIWSQMLQVNQIGVTDNFFELGGHSLLATQTVSRLREAFGVELALRVLFDHATVAELATYLQAVRKGETQEVPIVPQGRDGSDLPLSFAQQRLWFMDRFMPDSALYNIPTVLRIEGELNPMLLEASVQVLIDRHESLRTTFAEVDGKAVQMIAPEYNFQLTIEDLRSFEGAEQEAELDRLIQEDVVAPFDLARGPLMRAKLLQLGAETFVLLVNMHHIISDGWSLGVFLRELTTVYEAQVQGKQPTLPELPVQYADFAVWQREWLQGNVLDEQLSYWKQKLQGAQPLLQLPTDHPRPAVQTYNGATTTVALPKTLAERLNALSRKAGTTLFMTLLATFNTLMYRYTMQADILVGSPNAGRNRSEIEGLIGFFVNTLVLRTDLSGNPTFKELLAQVRDTALEAYAHQDLPFEKIVDELQPERSLSYSPLFQVFFSLQNALVDFEAIEGLNMSLVDDLDNAVTSKYDLSLFCLEKEDGFYTTFEYNTDLFEASTILKMASHFETLLTAIAENPEQRIGSLTMLGEQEQQQLATWNENKLDAVPQALIHQLVEAQAERTPDAVALVVDTESITYAELNQRANRLAHYLHKQGVTAGSLVGICTERTADMVVGLLGILKSSAAYVPLDPMYPQDRIAYTLEDAKVSVLLTQERLVAELPEHGAQVVRLDADWDAIAQEPYANPECVAKTDDLAYVIYTSGSTGRPKGVAIEHRNAVTFIAWAEQVFTAEQLRGVLASTSICFDLSVYELFVTLSVGGKVILAENALYLPMLPAKDDVTLINTVPSAAAELVRMNGIPQSVRTVNLAGEPLPNALAQQLYATGHVEAVYNLYGPSEDTTYSTYALVVKGAETAPTIGHPIANTQAYLLDQNGQQVPIGVPGELYLAGDGLARGYLNQPDLTAERFVANPFSTEQGARMYRTGDLTRFLPNGELEYLGRIDHQVKVRGFRIELGEIETVLAAHPAVREKVVVVREDKPNEKRIVAYLSGEEQEIAEMRRFVKEKLPDYMVPSAFVWLDALPLTPNGKVDRKSLPVPEIRVEPVQGAEATTEIERLLTEIYCSVLGLSQVGIHDNFFELGGDSILSIQIVARLNQTGWRVTPKQMFHNQTIAELAATIQKNKIDLPVIVAEQGLVTGEVPLLPIQKWFFEQEHPNPHHWNQSMLVTMKHKIDPADLQLALAALLSHHDALRLRFEQEAGVWKQVNTAECEEVPLQVLDLSDHHVAELKQAIENAAIEAQSSLHLTEGPVLRAVYFDLGQDLEARLLLVIHHLAVDGVSWRILLEDLQTACEQLGAGIPVQLPRKTTSYKEWSEKLAEYAHSDSLAAESQYWLSQNTANVVSIPREYASGANTEETAEQVVVTLSAEETKLLLSDSLSKHRANMDEVLLTALGWALSKWTRKGSYLVHLEGHGREEIVQGTDLSRTVGWFTTLYPVLLDLGNSANFTDALKSVKDGLRGIPNKGTGYGLVRYVGSNTADAQALRNKPQAEISFNYLGQFDQVVNRDSFFNTAPESSGPNLSTTAKRPHLLDFVSVVSGGELHITCLYGAQFHNRHVIETLVRDLAEGVRWFVSSEGRETFGFTASDFAEADLDQASLNKVLKKLKKGKGR